MNCAICGAVNEENSEVCVSCGNKLEVYVDQISDTVSAGEEETTYQGNNYNQSFDSNSSFNYLTHAIGTLIKPFDTFKKNEKNLKEPKNSFILAAIIAGVMMIINFIKSMISAIFVKKLDYSTWEYKTELDFSQLKDLDYLQLIGKNLLIYLAIIFVIAIIYYVSAVVAKKSPSFVKLVSVSATSFIPYIVVGMILSPILGKLWTELGVISGIMAIIYSIVIFAHLVSDEVSFDNKNYGIYYHLVAISLLLIIVYFVGSRVLTSGIMDILG